MAKLRHESASQKESNCSIGADTPRIQSGAFHNKMAVLFRLGPMAAVLVSLCALPGVCEAQSVQPLRTATMAASAAAAADWASTYHALKFFQVRETNPFLRPFDRTPGRMVTLGAAMDVGAISAWNLTMGREHPKVAVAGLWAMTAFRSYLAIHNLRNERRADRR
jgi:hypothetical protein